MSENDGLTSAQHTAMQMIDNLFRDDEEDKKPATSVLITPSHQSEVEHKTFSSHTQSHPLKTSTYPSPRDLSKGEGGKDPYCSYLQRFCMADYLSITTVDPTICIEETHVTLNYRYSYGYGFFYDCIRIMPPQKTCNGKMVIHIPHIVQHLYRRHHLHPWSMFQWGRLDVSTSVYGLYIPDNYLQKNEKDKKSSAFEMHQTSSSACAEMTMENLPVEYATIFSTHHFPATPILMIPSIYDELRIELRFETLWNPNEREKVQAFLPRTFFDKSPFFSSTRFMS